MVLIAVTLKMYAPIRKCQVRGTGENHLFETLSRYKRVSHRELSLSSTEIQKSPGICSIVSDRSGLKTFYLIMCIIDKSQISRIGRITA